MPLAHLPLPTQGGASEGDRPQPRMRRHILVVEDDADIRMMLLLALTTVGYPVREAADGAAALVQLQQEPWPWLIVTDLEMPTLDGYGLGRALAEHPGRIPLLLLSGADDVSDAALAVGAVAALRKPVDLRALFAAVARAEAQSGGGAG